MLPIFWSPLSFGWMPSLVRSLTWTKLLPSPVISASTILLLFRRWFTRVRISSFTVPRFASMSGLVDKTRVESTMVTPGILAYRSSSIWPMRYPAKLIFRSRLQSLTPALMRTMFGWYLTEFKAAACTSSIVSPTWASTSYTLS